MIGLAVLLLILLGALAASAAFVMGAFHVEGARPAKPGLMARARYFIMGERPLALSRAIQNPIMGRRPNFWEAGAVMNPAALVANGKVHLFYRAVGMDGVSRIGYARSTDGLSFDERLPYPVFQIRDGDAARDKALRAAFNPMLYAALLASGGSWSGVEDPRAILVGERVYLSFSAFNTWDSLRIGVASISLDDLEHERWNWSAPVFLSAPGEVHKNWVLFPRKVNGKFAVLHGFRSGTRRRALIEYLDTLDEEPAEYVKSDARFRNDPKEYDENVWDARIRGSGPPPVETSAGWLVFYHANDLKESHKYKIGAILLDRNDPSKIIARSPYPVLEPDMPYENEGKPGIVYACGAVVKDGMLIVYYGGGDNVICAAAAPLDEFLRQLSGYRRPLMQIRQSFVPLPA